MLFSGGLFSYFLAKNEELILWDGLGGIRYFEYRMYQNLAITFNINVDIYIILWAVAFMIANITFFYFDHK